MSTMTTVRKKLIEVALPLDVINTNAGKEKNIHVGLLSNMHTWWSRKPLGVARAILFASIVTDPGDDVERRQYLFDLLGKLSDPDYLNDTATIAAARAEIVKATGASHQPFWDPFSGGGSLPMEALRLGLKPTATDINPVAVLLNRIACDLAPGFEAARPIHPRSLADLRSQGAYGALICDVENYAADIGDAVRTKLDKIYPRVRLPKELGGAEVDAIAWIWARTVRCPNPACGIEAPLTNKFWLSTHKGNEAWVEPGVSADRSAITFKVRRGAGSPRKGTISRTGGVCLACNEAIRFEHIRAEGNAGRVGSRLLAVVAEHQRRRIYLDPLDEYATIGFKDQDNWIPSTSLPQKALGFRVQNYGINLHAQLFTARQLTVISTICDAVRAVADRIASDGGSEEYKRLVSTFLALGVSRLAQTNNTLVRWLVRKSGTSKGTPAFDRQIVSMTWEFSEGNVFGTSVGSWQAAYKNPLTSLSCLPRNVSSGSSSIYDASSGEAAPTSLAIISTDPPYFDNIGYADLSDFFYIWLRQCLKEVHPDLFGTLLTPKSGNMTSSDDPSKNDALDANEFSRRLSKAFDAIREAAHDEYPVTVYYAFKQSEAEDDDEEEPSSFHSTGWETFLEGLIASRFCITGTWPLRTESATRIRAIGANALASSIVLACRRRPENASVSTRASFLSALKRELPAALRMLQEGNIAPVDLAQASIGPGMGIFTRHSKVLEADDSAMTVKTALQLINQALDDYLSEQESEYESQTRFAITWFETHGMNDSPYGDAETLAKARNVSVSGVAHAGLIESKGGKVRLKKRSELPSDWDPLTDKTLTVWECAQHLIRVLESDGESAAAALLVKLGSRADATRDLAYRLYQICERRKWADEARVYNGLVVAWPELQKLASQQASAAPQTPAQATLI
ncbi:MAG: DUF1156 domain-containing protein [Hyphomicrobium sp.]|nr:DUF1156 domain-containing protein [Hyphomicrobium sp.]